MHLHVPYRCSITQQLLTYTLYEFDFMLRNFHKMKLMQHGRIRMEKREGL